MSTPDSSRRKKEVECGISGETKHKKITRPIQEQLRQLLPIDSRRWSYAGRTASVAFIRPNGSGATSDPEKHLREVRGNSAGAYLLLLS